LAGRKVRLRGLEFETGGSVNATVCLVLVIITFVLAGCGRSGGKDAYPDLLYLGWDANNENQIFRLNADDEVVQLTQLANGVYDFAVSPSGTRIGFTTADDNSSSAIWQLEINDAQPTKILDCPKQACTQPVWAPDGKRLIYERREIISDGISGSPYLWWLNTATGDTYPVLEDSEARGTAVRFSPDGSWLSYVSPEDEGVYVYHLEDGRSHFFPNEVGMPTVWSPNSDQIIVPNLDLVIVHGDEGDDHLEHTHDYQTATHLFIADTETGELKAISGGQNVEDSVAAWSPDGTWIAFGRRPPRTSAGRQLWLMRPDGSDARPLTEDPDVNYGPPFWSPDGRYLLFQRIMLADPQSGPGIWMLDLQTGEQTELIDSGMQPQWLD